MRENVGGDGAWCTYLGAWMRGMMVSAFFWRRRPTGGETGNGALVLQFCHLGRRVNDQEQGTAVDAIGDRSSPVPIQAAYISKSCLYVHVGYVVRVKRASNPLKCS